MASGKDPAHGEIWTRLVNAAEQMGGSTKSLAETMKSLSDGVAFLANWQPDQKPNVAGVQVSSDVLSDRSKPSTSSQNYETGPLWPTANANDTVFNYSGKHGYSNTGTESCALCFESMDPKTCKILLCGHGFHIECISCNMLINSNCPLCEKQ